MRRPRRWWWVLLGCVACGVEAPPSTCQVGTIEACACADGQPGARGCTDDGLWGPCVFCGKAELVLGARP